MWPATFLTHELAWSAGLGRIVEAAGAWRDSAASANTAIAAGHHVVVFPGGAGGCQRCHQRSHDRGHLMPSDQLDDFVNDVFDHDGTSRRIFRKGDGPGVLIMTEVPGITPQVADFARRVVDAGFTVAMPDLFGDAGRPLSIPYALSTMAKLCVSKEFTLFATGRSSPITDWLRALGADLHERAGGPGIGAIGMCLTGGFALSLAVDDHLLAPVLSQPSLPSGPFGAKGIDISAEGLEVVKQRCATEDLCVMGLRFRRDPLSPAARFTWLREQLGDAFVGIEIDPEHANPRGRPVPPHSVVTTDCIDEPGQPTHDAWSGYWICSATGCIPPDRHPQR